MSAESQPEAPKRGAPLGPQHATIVKRVQGLKAAGWTYAQIGNLLRFTEQNAHRYGEVVAKRYLQDRVPFCRYCLRPFTAPNDGPFTPLPPRKTTNPTATPSKQ